MFYHDITPEYLSNQGINPEGLTFGPNFLPYNSRLKQYSRDLRKGHQIAEVKMWKCLRAKNMGYAFRRQYPILNYIADFYCKQLNLVVEIDGYSHFSAEAQEKDAERDRQMQAIGLMVIRVNDGEVRKDAERIADWIIEQAVEENEKRRVFLDSPFIPLSEGEAQSDAGAKP
ncbi:MAG: DUF559 domain-containing protein [bacterium]|nr:DUF559 domain-containing protein [bacterium]